MNPDAMARGLGWFSLGLGMTELVAAERLAESMGMEGHETLIRAFGTREIASGLGCLGGHPPTTAVWSRVVGDALDIAVLAAHMGADNPKRHNVGIALAAVVGVTLMDILTATWLSEGRRGLINRTVRSRLESWEGDNEQRMRDTARRGGQYASEVTAEAAMA